MKLPVFLILIFNGVITHSLCQDHPIDIYVYAKIEELKAENVDTIFYFCNCRYRGYGQGNLQWIQNNINYSLKITVRRNGKVKVRKQKGTLLQIIDYFITNDIYKISDKLESDNLVISHEGRYTLYLILDSIQYSLNTGWSNVFSNKSDLRVKWIRYIERLQ